MAVIAPVVDGELQDTTTISANKKSNSSLDKDAFLQLLVAQMKYQDPLEPTSNTEYIAQLATFSELEEMQNLRSSSDLGRASSLVGKEVIMRVTNEKTGNTEFFPGRVDYVTIENGKAMLSINGSNYSLDDLDTVIDGDYLTGYNKASEWISALNELPLVPANITLDDHGKIIEKLHDDYEKMSDYEKSFIASDAKALFDQYYKRYEELKAMEDKDDPADPPENTK